MRLMAVGSAFVDPDQVIAVTRVTGNPGAVHLLLRSGERVFVDGEPPTDAVLSVVGQISAAAEGAWQG